MKKLFSFLFVYFLINPATFSQDDKSLLTDLLKEDQQTIEALVLYPDSIRRIILEAAGQPDALARMENLHEKTQEKFKDIISPFSQEVQANFYELARHPRLIHALVLNGKKTKTEIKSLLSDFPEETHINALKLGRKRYAELGEIDKLHELATQAFIMLKGEYPLGVQTQLEQLLKMPEVLDILMENFRSTVLMGAIYRRDPKWVERIIDSTQMEVAIRKTKELTDWKESLKNDSKALEEFESAAEDFAEEHDNNSADYRTRLSENDIYSRFYGYYTPYSYWLGYPYWYTHPSWYTRPYWYYWGFYYDLNNQIVIFDLPSRYFMSWYFSRNYHHYYYPHLSNRYLTHYERHRSSTLSATSRIRDWREQHNNTYSRDWLRNDARRIDRLRDYGSRDQTIRTRQVPTYRSPSTPVPNRPSRPQIREIERRRPIINRPTDYHREIQRKTNDLRVKKPQFPSSKPQVRQVRKKTTPVKRRRNL